MQLIKKKTEVGQKDEKIKPKIKYCSKSLRTGRFEKEASIQRWLDFE